MVNVKSHIAVVKDLHGNVIKSSTNLTIEAYESQRASLVQAEKAQRFDAEKLTRLTDAERLANAIVQQMKDEEDALIYSNPADDAAIKGMDWVGAKERGADKGALYRLVGQMPKGAALHCHLDATVDAEWVVKRALQESSIYMRSTQALSSPKALYIAELTFRLLSKQPHADSDGEFLRANGEAQNIFSDAYTPDTWVSLQRIRSLFPHGNVFDEQTTNSAEFNFEIFLRSLITMQEVRPQFAAPIKTSKQAWKKFLSTFLIIGGLCQNGRILKKYYMKGFESYIQDNISYIEVRMNFILEMLVDADGFATISHADMINTFQSALQEVQMRLPAGKTFDAKIIYCSVRIIDNEKLRWYIEDAITLKKQFPDLIVGFDLVGHEDPGVTLRQYAPELLRMKERVLQEGIELPFVFHAGETTSDGDAVDENLFDAILLGTKRIGHGFSLIQHPHLIDLVKTRQICIESCPISNQLLRFASSTAVHPILPLLARSVPVAISNDDPTQFQNTGLTPDFYQLLSASDHFTLTSLGVLARDSLRYSLMGKDQKSTALAQWDRDWAAFIDQVAVEYGTRIPQQ